MSDQIAPAAASTQNGGLPIESGQLEEARQLIEEAFSSAEARNFDRAVQFFHRARRFSVQPAFRDRVDHIVRNTYRKLNAEASSFRQAILARNNPQIGRSIVVFSDSLGLPRPEGNGAPEKTYVEILQDHYLQKNGGAQRNVIPVCRRYATTRSVRLQLEREPVADNDVIIHVGVNDAAARIFLERERLALQILPADIRDRIVSFGQLYRWEILKRYDDYNYVPIDEFRKNVFDIANYAIANFAASVTFVNIISLPPQAERSTPNLRWNFSRYNFVFYEVAKELGVRLIDIDRLAVQRNYVDLWKDLIHLSPQGHALLAERFIQLDSK